MSKTYFLVIEDGLSWRRFQRGLPSDVTTVCKDFGEATIAINQLALAEDDHLLVVLDHQLGESAERDGVVLYLEIRKKFPQAFIINYSSDPQGFLKELHLRSGNNSLKFDKDISEKQADVCIKYALNYAVEKQATINYERTYTLEESIVLHTESSDEVYKPFKTLPLQKEASDKGNALVDSSQNAEIAKTSMPETDTPEKRAAWCDYFCCKTSPYALQKVAPLETKGVRRI